MNMQQPQTSTERRFITGNGQAHTNKTSGAEYEGITGKTIAAMVKEPPSVPKDRAQWFIPSTYRGRDGRCHDAQRQHGAFWWLALDVDANNLALGDVLDALNATVGGCGKLVYSTASATPENRKWRALVPLKQPVAGGDYSDTANAFFDLLEEASAGILIPDRALARPGQLVYLPNRGAFYEQHIERSDRLDLTADHPIIRKREATRKARADAEREAAQERARRAERRRVSAGEAESPVDTFNAHHAVAELLERYGYQRAGHGRDWRSPFQTSGTFATRDCGDFWVSLSASDAAEGIGAETRNGHRHGDAFDLFAHFEHGGDFHKAVAAYGAEIKPERQMPAPETPPAAATSDGKPRPNSDDDVDLSHDALASDMGARGWDRDARHVATWGRWLFWTGSHWQPDTRLDHMTRTRGFLRERAAELVEWAERKADKLDAEEGEGKGDKLRGWAKDQARTLRSKTTVAAVESLARANRRSVAQPDDFDGNRLLLGTPGGTVDLRTGILREARRDDMLTKQTATTPAQGTPERWLRFLHEVFDGDAELVAFMQRAAGYALTGETREHKLLFLYGTGRNGKSVFLNTLFEIWGDYARRAHATTFLNSTGEKHPTDLAGLQGARLAAGSELPVGKTWDESVIKDLTGGDTMTARYMRGDFFDFEPQLTLMIAGNNQPSFRGVDEAIRARVVLVPFTVTFPPEQRDQHLPEKLRREAPQILQWAIEGALEWQRRGLDVPATVAAASAEYFDDEDTLGQFLADETTDTPSGFVTTSDLHQRFTQWCERQGLRAWTLRTLQKEVKGRGYQAHRRNQGAGFVGLHLK